MGGGSKARHTGRGRAPVEGSGLDAVDAHVGGRVRLRRSLLGLSQTDLGQRLGVTYQQVQKYEAGRNGIAASRLWQLAEALDVPVSFFFDGMPDGHAAGTKGGETPLDRRETLELLACYYRLADPKLRRRVLALLEATVVALEDAGA